ncbi:MAG: hypothetical protein AABX54_04705 [Nanoarchaeota archaeon]
MEEKINSCESTSKGIASLDGFVETAESPIGNLRIRIFGRRELYLKNPEYKDDDEIEAYMEGVNWITADDFEYDTNNGTTHEHWSQEDLKRISAYGLVNNRLGNYHCFRTDCRSSSSKITAYRLKDQVLMIQKWKIKWVHEVGDRVDTDFGYMLSSGSSNTARKKIILRGIKLDAN